MTDLVSVEDFELKGAQYLCADYQLPVKATVCVGAERTVLKEAKMSIKIVTDRYKFPDEVVFTLRSSKASRVKLENRNPSSWNTMEAYMPLDHARELLLKTLENVERRLKEKGVM